MSDLASYDQEYIPAFEWECIETAIGLIMFAIPTPQLVVGATVLIFIEFLG